VPGAGGTKNFDMGGSTRIMEAGRAPADSRKRFTISLHFRMISEALRSECATLEMRILRIRSGPFSVNTPVMREPTLDGEGRLTDPAAVRDSSHGRPKPKMRPNIQRLLGGPSPVVLRCSRVVGDCGVDKQFL